MSMYLLDKPEQSGRETGLVELSTIAFYAVLATVMGGAVTAHVTVLGGSPAPAVGLLILTGMIAYLRKP